MYMLEHEKIINSPLIDLGSLVETKKGFAFKSSWFINSGRQIVKVSDFTEDSISIDSLCHISEEQAQNYLKYELKTKDVIIQTVGSWPSNPKSVVGKVVRVPRSCNNALLNQNAVILYPKPLLDKDFLFYLLKCEHFKSYIVGCAQGAASQASITLEAIKSYQFNLPSLETQQKIASLLSAYDGLIENNLRRIKILEEMAQAIYKEWFVHFRYPGHENIPLVDSPLGPIPQGWEVKSLYDISTVIYGFPFKSKLFTNEPTPYPVVRIRNIKSQNTDTFTPEQAPDKYIIEKEDILIGMDGDFHMVNWTGVKAYLNQRVVKIRAFDSISNLYLFLALEKPIHFFNATIVGTTVAHLSAENMKSINILIPEKEILAKANKILNNILHQMINIQTRNDNLCKTRDLLLPRLISGQLDVSNLEVV